MGSPYEMSLLRCNCHMRSLGSLCVLMIFCPVKHEPVCVPRGFRKMPLRMQCGPVQTPYGLWNNLRPVLHTSMGQNTRSVEPTSMGAIWTMHDSLRAQNRRKPISESSTYPIFHPKTIRPHTGPTINEKSYKPAARSSAQSDQGFRRRLCA